MPLGIALRDGARPWIDAPPEKVLSLGELYAGPGQRQARVRSKGQSAGPAIEVIDPDEALDPSGRNPNAKPPARLVPYLVSEGFRA